MMMERQWSSYMYMYRERLLGQHAEIMPHSSLEATTDALLEIMEVGCGGGGGDDDDDDDDGGDDEDDDDDNGGDDDDDDGGRLWWW